MASYYETPSPSDLVPGTRAPGVEVPPDVPDRAQAVRRAVAHQRAITAHGAPDTFWEGGGGYFYELLPEGILVTGGKLGDRETVLSWADQGAKPIIDAILVEQQGLDSQLGRRAPHRQAQVVQEQAPSPTEGMTRDERFKYVAQKALSGEGEPSEGGGQEGQPEPPSQDEEPQRPPEKSYEQPPEAKVEVPEEEVEMEAMPIRFGMPVVTPPERGGAPSRALEQYDPAAPGISGPSGPGPSRTPHRADEEVAVEAVDTVDLPANVGFLTKNAPTRMRKGWKPKLA